MSKRARGGARPGQRRPNPRTTGRPVVARPAVAPAAAVVPTTASEATLTASAEPVASGYGFGAAESTTPRATRRRQASSSFSEAATQEYAYVVSDVRRIGMVGGSLFGVMIVLFILLEVVHAISL